MKRLYALLCLTAVLLAGCAPDTSTESAEPTEIVIFAASSLTDALDEMAAQFEEQHTGVSIVLEVLQEYAVMLSYQGKNADAAMINAHVIANTRTPGAVRKRAEAQTHILEVKLGAAAVAAAKAQGEAKPLADVVADVLKGP